MPFPQDQVAYILANRNKLFRFVFLLQMIAAFLFLAFAQFHRQNSSPPPSHRPPHPRNNRRFCSRSVCHAREPKLRVHVSPHGLHAGHRLPCWRSPREIPRVERVGFSRRHWDSRAHPVRPGRSLPRHARPRPLELAALGPCFGIGLLLLLASLKGLFSFLTN